MVLQNVSSGIPAFRPCMDVVPIATLSLYVVVRTMLVTTPMERVGRQICIAHQIPPDEINTVI